MVANYGLPDTYISRLEPAYFNDTLDDSEQWQADVYRLAARLARKSGATRLVDIGCGRAGKLLSYAADFAITGYDFGDNIRACQTQYPAGEWIETNLNETALEDDFSGSVVICADVIEHLPTPDALIQTFKNACDTADYVLISTPDRARVGGASLNGMPRNPYHVREWTNSELVTWFKSEGLPVVWWGWTISNDKHPEQVWTSLVALSKHHTVGNIPVTFETAGAVQEYKALKKADETIYVWMTPTPDEAGRDYTNSIHQIVVRLDKLLPSYGVQLINHPNNADLKAAHAGQGVRGAVDVAHYHGLYPTAQDMNDGGYFGINAKVIQNLKTAKAITAPSEWIADIIRRDMHINPHVIGWGVDSVEWTPPKEVGNYVIWNKARVDAVCDPSPMLALAGKAHDTLFLTTFGEGTPNVKTVGRQPYNIMRDMVRNAAVYLSTNVETFGVGTLEAMACGIPILGYRLSNTDQIVEHGVHGFLAEPGDIDGLYEGLKYCLKYRNRLGANARARAKEFTWDKVAQSFAAVYRDVLNMRPSETKVSVIIPCHNYARYLPDALESVLAQQTNFPFEIIVVLDRCEDDSQTVAKSYAKRGVQYITVNHGNLSLTRNSGIERAKGDYICCLDADDRLGSPLFLQTLADALDSDRQMGIAFTSIHFMDSEGKLGHKSTWPNGYDYEKQLHRFNQVPSCCLFRKEAWKRAGGFKSFFVYAQDAEFWTQVGALGYTAKHVTSDSWFHYRLHDQSQSMAHRTGKVPEPDWTEYYPQARDNERPFASDGNPPRGSWPVRFYNKPDVSVIIPVGKGHETAVKDALHSVEGQTHRLWECIVVNDTGKPLKLTGFEFARVLDLNTQGGAGKARNEGARLAKAPFLVFLDADDMLKPDFIAETLKAYRQHGRYAYTDWLTHEQQTNWQIHESAEYDTIREKPAIHPVTALIPKQWFWQAGGFDENLTYNEDIDLIMRLFVHGFCGIRVPKPLMIYNLNSGMRRKNANEGEFKALLIERYGAYMRGEKEMCNCVEPPKGKKPVAPSPENLADYQSTYGDMVKIQYTWDYAPAAPVMLKGPATNAPYGRRAKGEIFYIWQKDLENSEAGMFTRIDTYAAPPVETVTPPEPPVVETIDAPEMEMAGYADFPEDSEPELESVKPVAKPRGKPGRKAKVK